MIKRKSVSRDEKNDAKSDRVDVNYLLSQKTNEERTSSIDAIETVQVIAALLAGTGIAFLDDVNNGNVTTTPLTELIRFFCLVFVGLNLYGLTVLSNVLFYLRQILAKDTAMFEPFMDATKNTRYWALKGVLYSMVSCVAVVGLRQLQHAERSPICRVGGFTFVGLALLCLRVMWRTRQEFAKLRRKSKARLRLKASGHAVGIALRTSHDRRVAENDGVNDNNNDDASCPVTPSPGRHLASSWFLPKEEKDDDNKFGHVKED